MTSRLPGDENDTVRADVLPDGDGRRADDDRLQLALEASGLGTFVWYPDEDRGEPDERMLELFGLEPDAPLDLSEALATLIHPDDRERYAGSRRGRARSDRKRASARGHTSRPSEQSSALARDHG